jgi:putative membrane protein
MRLVPRLAAVVAVTALALTGIAAPAQAAPAAVTAHAVQTATGGGDRICRQDRLFLAGAHQSNLAEILGGYLALGRSRNQHVRHIAQMLITDHTRLDKQVRRVARERHVALPATPSARQVKELLAVALTPNNRFDHAWLRLQEVSHVRTLALINAELRRGCSAQVKALARAAAPAVRAHLVMVREALADHHRH